MPIANLTEREGKTILKYLIPTDRRKNAADILLDAILNIRAGMTEPIPYRKVLKVVHEWYGGDWSCRKSGLEKEQRVAMYLMYELSGLEYDEIAVVMGQKNHAIVIRSVDRVAREAKNDEKLRGEILDIVEKLKCGISIN